MRIRADSNLEVIMASSFDLVHYFLDFKYDISADLSISPLFTEYNSKNTYNLPLIFTIQLNDFVFPDFQISLKFSQNINDSNFNNLDIKQSFIIDNLDSDIYYTDTASYSGLQPDEILESNGTTRLLQDTGNTSDSNSGEIDNNTTDGSTNDSADSSSSDNTDSSSTNAQDIIDFAQASVGGIYKKPVIDNFSATIQEINFRLLQPSLSQKIVTIVFYNFLLPEDQNQIELEFSISVRNTTLYAQNESFEFNNASSGS